MLEIHEIRALVIKHLTDEVTEAEMLQLEEWASLSTENRIWLQRFFDLNWVAARIVKYRSFDPEENRENMWARITLRQKEKARLNRKFRKRNRVVKVAVLLAGIAWPVLEFSFQNATPSAKAAQVHRTNANQTTKLTPTNENDRTAEQKTSNVKNEKAPASLPVIKNGKNTKYASIDNTSPKGVTPNDSSIEQKRAQTTNEKELASRPVTGSEMDVRYANMVNTASKEKEPTVMMPAGGLLTYTLPDGSKVWLNAVSTIKFPNVFNGPIRNVRITGEAYFEVQPDSVPFRVVANGVTCKVYSGRFNIRDYTEDGKTIVTALEGDIHIVTGPIDTILTTGQSAIIEPKRKLTLIQADADRITDWKMGLFLFKDDDLEFVAHELARWYGLTVQFNTKSKMPISWTGSRQEKITEVIKGIMSQNNVCMKVQGSRLIIN